MNVAKIAPNKYPGALARSSNIPSTPTANHLNGNKYDRAILFLIGKKIPL